MKRTKKTTIMAFCIALAMILSYVESQIPSLIPIPGVKMGLANIVVVFALYRLGGKQAIVISLIRVFLLALMFGSLVSIAYSFAGALLSLSSMFLLKKTNLFSCVAISVVGGVSHNLGQILMAMLILQTSAIKYYFPYLMISGILSGIMIGVIGGVIINRFDIKE